MESEIALANKHVSFLAVCRMVGMHVPDVLAGTAPKTLCPFGHLYHADGGYESAFRVYVDANNGFCFAGCGFFSCVSLYAKARDLSAENAAKALLATINYVPEDLNARWEHIENKPRAQISTAQLAEALKIYCASVHPDWEELQFFNPKVSYTLKACLGLLPSVQTEEDVQLWLSRTKEVMKEALDNV